MQSPSQKLIKKFNGHHLRKPLTGGDKLKIRFVGFCISTMNTIVDLFKKVLFRTTKNPKKILIFRTGSLGDSVCATPALNLIRRHYPGARITLLSNAGKKSLVSPDKVIDRILYDDMINYLGIPFTKLLKSLRKEKFDLVIHLTQVESPFLRLLRDMILLRFVAPSGWGWRLSRIMIFRKKIEKYIFYPNEAQRLLWICRENGLKYDEMDFKLNFENEDKVIAENYFTSNDLNGKQVIAISVGANSVKNRWPIEYFAEVINFFRLNHPIILIGGPEDNELVQPFINLKGVYNCCGLFTPMQSALLIKKCSLSLTNDTGPLHLSYAVGTPLIGLFASRDFYGKWFPPEGTRHHVFRTPDVACSLCFFSQCDNNICMKAIKPADVIKAAEEIMM